jgi:hypothetical protein
MSTGLKIVHGKDLHRKIPLMKSNLSGKYVIGWKSGFYHGMLIPTSAGEPVSGLNS